MVDSIKKEWDNEDAIARSRNCDHLVTGTKGRTYYKGVEAKSRKINGHNCYVDKNGRILKDFNAEITERMNVTNRAKWDEAIQEARDNGWKCFRFNRVYKTLEFKDRPSGWYEFDTYRRVWIAKISSYAEEDENGKRHIVYYKIPKYYKYYDAFFEYEARKMRLTDDGRIISGYSWIPDYSKTKVEISKEEWDHFFKIGMRESSIDTTKDT